MRWSDPMLCYAMRGKIRQFSCFFDNFCYFCFFDQFKAILDPFWISGPHVSMFFLNTYFAMPFWLCFFFYKIQRTEKHEKLSKPRESQWPGKSFLWSLEPKNQFCESQWPGKSFLWSLVPKNQFDESQWPGKSFFWSLEPKNQFCESQWPGKSLLWSLEPKTNFVNPSGQENPCREA